MNAMSGGSLSILHYGYKLSWRSLVKKLQRSEQKSTYRRSKIVKNDLAYFLLTRISKQKNRQAPTYVDASKLIKAYFSFPANYFPTVSAQTKTFTWSYFLPC